MASNRSGSGGAEVSGAEGGGSRGQPLNFKVVLLGEGAVGKTSLVLRYVENNFNDKHLSTLQVPMGKEQNGSMIVMEVTSLMNAIVLSYGCGFPRVTHK